MERRKQWNIKKSIGNPVEYKDDAVLALIAEQLITETRKQKEQNISLNQIRNSIQCIRTGTY